MIKNRTYRVVNTILLCLFMQVSGCKEKNSPDINRCETAKNECLSFVSDKIEVQFNKSRLFVEQPIKVNFVTESSLQRAYLSSVNMDMGRIPLYLNKTAAGYETTLVIGICAEPTMVWELTLDFEDDSSERFQLYSYWNEDVYQTNIIAQD